MKVNNQKIENDLEEKIKKVSDRKGNLELTLLLEILKSLNRLMQKY